MDQFLSNVVGLIVPGWLVVVVWFAWRVCR